MPIEVGDTSQEDSNPDHPGPDPEPPPKLDDTDSLNSDEEYEQPQTSSGW